MITEKDRNDIIRYLMEEMDAAEADLFRHRLAADLRLNGEKMAIESMWSELKEAPLYQPDADVQVRFDRWLSTSQSKDEDRHVRRIVWPAVAAAVAVLLGLFWLNRPVDDQTFRDNLVKQSEPAHFQWASLNSPTSRIKEIREVARQSENDPEIVNALINLLLDDKSPNVRLSIVDALQRFAMDEQIKQGYLKALETESVPAVQIALVQALVGTRDETTKPHLEKLIDSERIAPYVKDEVHLGLTRL